MIKFLWIPALTLLMSACGGQAITDAAADPDQAALVFLKVEQQRVVRYDCDGHVREVRLETLRSESKRMELRPARPAWLDDDIVDSSFHNTTTGSTAHAYFDRTSFDVDLADGYFTMRVRPGLNRIKYSFQFSNGDHEFGYRYLDVRYDERLVGGTREVRPPLETCF